MLAVRIIRHGDPCCLCLSQHIAIHRTLWRVEENPLTSRMVRPLGSKDSKLGPVADLKAVGMVPAKADP